MSPQPPPTEAACSNGPTRSTDLGPEMLPRTKWLTKGVFDQHSGVQFMVRDKNVVAVLGHEAVTLPGVALAAIKEAISVGVFPGSIRRSFSEVVIPQLIEPARLALIKEIKKFRDGTQRRDTCIREVAIQSEEPLQFSLRGVLYSGMKVVFGEYEGCATWDKSGDLAITAYGQSKRVPAGHIVNSNRSMLEMILSEIGKLYGRRS